MFGDVQCDFYQDDDTFCMTINQLAQALEYASKSGVENLLARNEYLKDAEFSSTHKLWAGNSMQNTRVFTEDGIYEVTMLAKTEKAKIFRAFVRKTLKGLRTGQLHIMQASQDLGNYYVLIFARDENAY